MVTSSNEQRNQNITAMVTSLAGGRAAYYNSLNQLLVAFPFNNPAATIVAETATFSFTATEVDGELSGNVHHVDLENSSNVMRYRLSSVALEAGEGVDVVVTQLNVVPGAPFRVGTCSLNAPL